jgi:hypothetical protein
MMKTSGLLSTTFTTLFFACIITTTPAHAAGTIASFAINDVVVKEGTSPLNIQGSYSVNGVEITIAPYGGNAIIEYNETYDWLRMRNAEITTTTAPIDNVKIGFWRRFDSLVSGTVTYSVSGSGTFSRSTVSSDPHNWISLRGYVETTVLGSPAPDYLTSPPPLPITCTQKLTACATHMPATWTFNLNQPNGGFKVSHSFGSPALATGSDDLKAEFWIHLEKATDRLDITGSPGIRVRRGAPGGEMPGGEGPDECPAPVQIIVPGNLLVPRNIDPDSFGPPAIDFYTPCKPGPGVSCGSLFYPGTKSEPEKMKQ